MMEASLGVTNQPMALLRKKPLVTIVLPGEGKIDILVAWFLVVFEKEVTEILCYSLFTFLLSKARQANGNLK